MKTPDWMSEDEFREVQRHTWNDLQYHLNNTTLTQRKWAGRGATVILVAMVLTIVSFLVFAIISAAKVVFG